MKVILALFFARMAFAAPGCPLLEFGLQLPFRASQRAPACFVAVVPAGVSAQIVAEQPEDLLLEASGQTSDTIVDAFEFGKETLTLTAPGRYRILVRPVPPVVRVTPAHIMLQELLPLHASEWSAAEKAATAAKRSGTLGDAEESARLWEKVGDASRVAQTHLQRGDSLLGTGDALDAREAYQKALALCQSVSDLRCAAEAANNVGWASEQLGEFDAALDRLTEAAEYWKRISDPLHEGQTLSNIGILFGRVSDFQKAIEYYRRSAILLAARDQLAYARVLNNLGLAYVWLAQYPQAKICLRRAETIESTRSDGALDAIQATVNLGSAYMLAGNLPLAEQTLNRALAAAMKHPNRQVRAMALNNLGQTLRRRHMLDAAQARLNAALELHRAVGDQRGASAALYQLGLVAQERGDSTGAHQFFEQAIEIQTKRGLHRAAVDSMAALAAVLVTEGNYGQAQVFAEKGAALLESIRENVPGPELRAAFYDRERQFLDVLVEIAMRPGNPSAAADGLLAAERGLARSLLEELAAGSLAHAVPAGLAAQRTELQRQIDLLSLRLSSASPAHAAELRQDVYSLLAKDTAVEAEIRTSVSASVGLPINTLEPWQHRSIPEHSAMLEFHLGERHSHLWFVTPDSIQVFELPPQADIDQQVRRAITLLAQVAERQRLPAKQAAFEGAMHRLSASLLGPLKDIALPPRLILVLDGSLHRAPFEALHLSSDAYLGLTHDLIRSPSASFLQAGREPQPPRHFQRWVLAIADPVFTLDDSRVSPEARKRYAGISTPDLARLPFMADIAAICQFVPEQRRRILTGFDANPTTIRQAPLQEFGVLHLSTHAFIDDSTPELSRIALSMVQPNGRPIDGFLHPHQLADLHLEGSTVVLSACDTALGKLLMGEGLLGLSSSLFRAGAGQLVLSLAKVDAPASAQFFCEVYRRIFGGRHEPMERALTLARRAMARSDRFSDPYYWAEFVVIGRPAPYE